MDHLPLIPTSRQKENHDTTHVIRDIFQEILDGKTFPNNLVNNIEKYNVTKKKLKEHAAEVTATKKECADWMENVANLEDEIMEGHAKYLIEADAIKQDMIATEMLRLKRKPMIEDLAPEKVEEYNLIQKIDLLPNRPERSMDFRINSNRHLCPQPCPKNDLDLIPTKLDKKAIKAVIPNKCVGYKKKKKTKPIEYFRASKTLFVFANYEINKVYEETFKLYNVTSSLRSFRMSFLPKSSPFSLEMLTNTVRVASGMCAVFKVTYKPVVYLDTEDQIVFSTYGGKDVVVTFKSSREAPSLEGYVLRDIEYICKSDNMSENFILLDEQRCNALNTTVDVGSCLLGNEIVVSLIIKNKGGRGDFIFITEDDWYGFDVSTIAKCSESVVNAFTINPSYFTINKHETVELVIRFFPFDYGLHTEKLFLHCNNCTFEELEFVGDGVLFELYYVSIEMTKKEDITSYYDEESEFFIFLGHCLPFSKLETKISVKNKSFIELPYRWDFRKTRNFNENTNLKHMKESWLKIEHHEIHKLPSNASHDFDITISANAFKEGHYSVVLSLYIEDVPEVSLSQENTFTVVEKPYDKDNDMAKCVDVLIGEVEIACIVVPVNLIIEPPQLIVPTVLEYQQYIIKKIQLNTNAKSPLHCEWFVTDKHNGKIGCVKIIPTIFTIEPDSMFICEVTIAAHNYEDISEKLILIVNHGLYQKEYYVMAKVEKPYIKISKTHLNFGFIPKGKDAAKSFSIISYCQEEIFWHLLEFTYDFNAQEVVEVRKENQMNRFCGRFTYYGEVVNINYNVEAKENHRWFSFLFLLSYHPTKIAMDGICLISYEVCQPRMHLQTSTSTNPILCPGELLFQGIPSYHQIKLLNAGDISGYFMWGDAIGTDSKYVNVTIKPKASVVHPGHWMKLEVELIPLKAGLFEHIYVPCFVGRTDDPIMLRILCAVDNIHVYFYLPNKQGRYNKILWPPKLLDELDFLALDYLKELEMPCEEEECSTIPVVQESSSEIVSPSKTILTLYSNEGTRSHSRAQSSSSSDIPVIPKKKLKSLVYCFKSDLVLQPNHVEVFGIPINTPTKIMFMVHNLTPISSQFYVEALNFGIDEVKVYGVVEDVLYKLNFIKTNRWEDYIKPGQGVTVLPYPDYSKIIAHETIEIEIWIYANTWGVYVDEITVEIDGLEPFSFSLLLEVIGIPLEYPMALNTIRKYPHLRFGYISYLSESIVRKLKVTNTSSIPITLFWRIYEDNSSLDVQIDKSEEEIIDGDVMRTKCLSDLTIFEVVPKEVKIQPKTTTSIEIVLYPKFYPTSAETIYIKAILIGWLNLDAENCYQPDYVNRRSGEEMDTTKLKIRATIEMPLLKLDTVGSTTKIKIYAEHILLEESITKELLLVFRNKNHSLMEVMMHADDPFEVIGLQTISTNEKYAKAALVLPDQILQVKLLCVLKAKLVLEMAKDLYSDSSSQDSVDVDTHSVVVKRYLNIHQKGVHYQTLPLYVEIFYPYIVVFPNPLLLGTIFAGSTKKGLITIRNLSGAPVPFTINNINNAKGIHIVPSKGTIDAAVFNNMPIFDLNIYFTPCEKKEYEIVIRVQTNIPKHFIDVNIYAEGSYNEKFYSASLS